MSTFNKYRLKGAYHHDWYKTEPWYKACVDTCVDFCEKTGQPELNVIDVGCGDGLLCDKLSEHGLDATGIDTDPDGLRLAIGHARGTFVRLDVSYLPGSSRQWEYMTCLNVIEHLDEPRALINAIHSNVTKGAIIITLEADPKRPLGEDHRKEYTLKELTDFFKEFKPKPFRVRGHPEWIGVKIKK